MQNTATSELVITAPPVHARDRKSRNGPRLVTLTPAPGDLPHLAAVSMRAIARLRTTFARRSVSTEAHIKAIGITLPPPGGPKANYTVAQWESPTVLYVSGHLPITLDGSMITGAIGPDAGGLSLEDGAEAARWCGLNLISTVQAQLDGDLDRVEKVVKVRDFKEFSTALQPLRRHPPHARASAALRHCRFEGVLQAAAPRHEWRVRCDHGGACAVARWWQGTVVVGGGAFTSCRRMRAVPASGWHQSRRMQRSSPPRARAQILGDRGYHARSAIGTNTLPLDCAVEVEAIIKVKA